MKKLKAIEEEIKYYDECFNNISYIDKERIILFINHLKHILFPKIFKCEYTIKELYIETFEILAFLGLDNKLEIVDSFFDNLIDIKKLLLKDIESFKLHDPACKSIEEVVLLVNSFHAVYVYRIAHLLDTLNVPFIPRILSEYAHSVTGIDIHPSCKIGENFFIDHGTGIVIGETCIIGNNVSIYQGVTLGAISLKEGSLLKGIKRHPTICDNVVIYANATILGGDTIIKDNSVIPGNAFITKSN